MRHRESVRPSRRSSAAKAISLGSAMAVLGSLMLAGPAHADSTRDKQYWLDSYGIRAAWDESQGEGVKVAVTDIVDPRGVVETIRTAGGEAIGLISDVSHLAACETMVEAAAKAFGGIDILVNNAAIFAAIER